MTYADLDRSIKERQMISLNPIKWLQSLLFSNYVGGFVRTALAILSGWLVSKGVATDQQASELSKLLTEILPGVMSALLAYGASVVNKQTAVPEVPLKK